MIVRTPKFKEWFGGWESEHGFTKDRTEQKDEGISGQHTRPDTGAEGAISRLSFELSNYMSDQGAINERSFALVEYDDAKRESRPMYLLDFKATLQKLNNHFISP